MQPRVGWPSRIGVVVDDLEAMAASYEALGIPRVDAADSTTGDGPTSALTLPTTTRPARR